MASAVASVLAYPTARLQSLHKSPLTVLVSWQWSIHSFPPQCARTLSPGGCLQIAHLPSCVANIASYSVEVIPYRCLRRILRRYSALTDGERCPSAHIFLL